ncbi:MAG TPA: hypothetical protein PKI01_03970 [Bacteroidales bacterium]|nr:hypothetical protein [Bacteroidales bacterium]
MTKHYKVLAACFLMFMLASCGPSKEEAIKYNDSIIDEQALIVEKINTLYKCIDDLDHPENMDEAYKQALMQVDSGTGKVSKLPDFDGKSDLREAALKLFSVYKSVIQKELKTMIDILKMSPVDITPEIETQFDTMNTQALNKMDSGLKEFQAVQIKFSEKYNFILTRSTETN